MDMYQLLPKVVSLLTLVALLIFAFRFDAHSASSAAETKTGPPEPTRTAAKPTREPAVAGLFYPKDELALRQMMDGFFASVPASSNAEIKALICPHAGYRYSGLTAAYAYKALAGRKFETVVILAPSHYALFNGASISAAENWRTPFGLTPVSGQAKQWAKLSPFVLERPCMVQRPPWWQEASKAAPNRDEDTPDTWEHSAEVQVPFLQKVLNNFAILPVVIGQTDPAQLAKVLGERLDGKTLLVASSDLSHYRPYVQAKELDHRCIKAICELNVEQMAAEEACGKLPILTLMHLARQKGWKPRLLDYRNSGDTAGDKSGVVGYAALAFFAEEVENFSMSERKQLLELARKTLREVVTSGNLPKTASLPKKLSEPKGCFVTLTKKGVLRGCIGHVFPQEPLYQAIMVNARNAALRDPRFAPVQAEELETLEVEVSVLTEPQPLQFSSPEDLLKKLQPHKDGVVLKINGHSATFLPQVWEQLPDKVQFLNNLAQKAGYPASAWKKPGATVLIYRVEAFKEKNDH